jgi:two-component system OmpR family response regulator
MKVCVIDDNKSITGMLEKLLKMKGHESVIINDSREGLSVLEKEVFDVVILDIAMPEFSGIDILDALNKSGRIKEQKICILTASSAGDSEEATLKEKGAKEVLKKPIDLNNMVSKLEGIANSN